MFPSVPWRRCYFHLCQNAQSYARKQEERKEISKTMRGVFSQTRKEAALQALRGAVKYWSETKEHEKFATWLEENAEESMTYFGFSEGWWRRIRTSNCIERLNKEIKKRTKVVGVLQKLPRLSHKGEQVRLCDIRLAEFSRIRNHASVSSGQY